MQEDLKELPETKQALPPPISTMQNKPEGRESKYLALRTISGIYIFLSVIIGIVAGIALFYELLLLNGRAIRKI